MPDGISAPDVRLPRIGYRNVPLDTVGAVITTDSVADGYAAANLFNWQPYNYYKPATGGSHYVRCVTPTPVAVDYFAVAQHDLAARFGSISLQYSTDSGGSWTDVAAPFTPSNRGALWFDFEPIMANYWQVVTDSADPAAVAIAAFGVKYKPGRGQFAGFMPPGMARSFSLYASTSESGLFLGRSILRKQLKGAIAFDLMEIGDAYGDWLPFMKSAERQPFFLAWMLEDWPDDVQLVQTDGDWTPPAMSQFGYLATLINYRGLLQE